MEAQPFSLQSPEKIAEEYGGNKQKIAQAVQMGIVDPTSGLLAGMFIDRMRSAQAMEHAPQQTVAQQVFAPPRPPMPPQGGLGATPQAAQMAAPMPMQAPAQAPAPQGPPGMAHGGLADLEVPDHMFDEGGYAGGGIIAFGDGGDVKHYDGSEGSLVTSNNGDDYIMSPEAAQVISPDQSLINRLWQGTKHGLMRGAEAAGAAEYNQGAFGANMGAALFGGQTRPYMLPAPTPTPTPPTLGHVDLTPFNPNASLTPGVDAAVASVGQAGNVDLSGLGSLAGAAKQGPPPSGSVSGSSLVDTLGQVESLKAKYAALGIAAPNMEEDINTAIRLGGDPAKTAGVQKLQDFLDNSADRLAKQKNEDVGAMLLELGGKIGSTPGAGFVPFAAGLQAIAPEVQSALTSEREAQAQNIKDQANLDLQMYGFKQKDIQAGVDAYFHKYDAYTRAATTAVNDAENNARAVQIAQMQDASREKVANIAADRSPNMQAARWYAQAHGNPNDPGSLLQGLTEAFRAQSIYGSAGTGANEKALSATNAIVASSTDPRAQQYRTLVAQDAKNNTTLAQDFFNKLLLSQQNAVGAGAPQLPNVDLSKFTVAQRQQ